MNELNEQPKNHFIVCWADLLTLLLVFFIYLYSISEIDIGKYIESQASLSNTFSNNNDSPFNDLLNQQKQLQDISDTLNAYIIENQLENDIEIIQTPQNIRINLGSEILFDSGKASIKTNTSKILIKISHLLQQSNGQIIIEGHTDNIPIQSDIYPSNWELSAARASAVARRLIQSKINSHRLRVTGYADTKPIAPNTSKQNRANNRRISILVKETVQ